MLALPLRDRVGESVGRGSEEGNQDWEEIQTHQIVHIKYVQCFDISIIPQ